MMAQPIFMEDGHTKKIFTTHETILDKCTQA